MKISPNLSLLAASRAPAPRVTRQAPADPGARFDRLHAAAVASPAASTSRTTTQSNQSLTVSQPAASQPAATANTSNPFARAAPVAAAAAATQAAAIDDHPTAESVFGASPWMTTPGGSGPLGPYYYNPMYFATRETADKVAQLLGGTVVAASSMTGAPGSPFVQSQPNYMVQLPNGHMINAGLTASYYTHGWSQSFIDHMLDLDRSA